MDEILHHHSETLVSDDSPVNTNKRFLDFLHEKGEPPPNLKLLATKGMVSLALPGSIQLRSLLFPPLYPKIQKQGLNKTSNLAILVLLEV